MAYNSTPPPSTPNSNNRNNTKGNNSMDGFHIMPDGSKMRDSDMPTKSTPFVEEVEPTPSPVLGGIKFQKTIYGQEAFRQKIDVSIKELKPQKEKIDIPSFFKHYRRIFFDIPQKGFSSHDTLIRESMDYVSDFTDPKDEQIRDLEDQIIRLENRIIELTTEALQVDENSIDSISDSIEAQSQQQILTLEIGNPNDPNIYWSSDSTRLLFPNGLKKTAKYAKNNEQLPNGVNPFEENNQNGLDRDINDAYDKGGDSGIRELQEIRTYSEWKADTKRRSSGGETRDIVHLLDYIKDFTKMTYATMIS